MLSRYLAFAPTVAPPAGGVESEVIFAGSAARASMASASSNFGAGYEVSYAFNGLYAGIEAGDRWISNNAVVEQVNPDGRCWAQFDFGTAKKISKIRFGPRGPSGNVCNYPLTIRVLAGSDPTFATYSAENTITGIVYYPGAWGDWLALTNKVSARYLRIEFHAITYAGSLGSSYEIVAIQEFQFYELIEDYTPPTPSYPSLISSASLFIDPLKTNCFQDTGGTIPVTADKDPVGRIVDLSGSGNHLISTGTHMPIWRDSPTGGYIEFTNPDPGVQTRKYLASGSIGAASACIGLVAQSMTAYAGVLSGGGTSTGSIQYVCLSGGAYLVYINTAWSGDGVADYPRVNGTVSSNMVNDKPKVLWGTGVKAAGDNLVLTAGTQVGIDRTTVARQAEMHLYGLFMLGSTKAEIPDSAGRDQMEQWMAGRVGAAYPF